jgi:predicted lipoprotein with Yx(FWY)xxD motif
MKRTTVTSTVFSALLLSLSFAAQANPTVESNGVLTNKEGKTLYTFTKDAAGKSNCNGACAAAWPPFMVANPALAGGDFTIVTRDDDAKQWAFKGMPMYFFAGDAKAGDMNGEGSGGVWFVIKPQAAQSQSTPRTSSRSSYSSSYDTYRY